MAKNFKYNVIFNQEPEGGFTVIVPSLPGCVSYGRNLIEARKMAKDAISAYLVSLKKHREPIPSDNQVFFSFIEVAAPSRSYARITSANGQTPY